MEIHAERLGIGAVLVRTTSTPSAITSTRLASLARLWKTTPGIHAVVTGLDSLVLHLDTTLTSQEQVMHQLPNELPLANDEDTRLVIEVGVCVDEQAIAAHAAACGLTATAVIERLCASPLTVGCIGFTPDFAYLLGVDPSLRRARRSRPQRVAAGSVALVEDMAAIYPREGPGGWHVIGHTDPAVCLQWRIGNAVHFHPSKG